MDQVFLRERAHGLWKEGRKLHTRGDLERAIGLYVKSIRTFPTAEAHTCLGWAYSYFKRLDEAIEECKKAIALDPGFGNPYNDIGTYLLAQGQPDAALDWFQKAKSAPRLERSHLPYMNSGRAFLAKGMLQRAAMEFKQALELHPGEPLCDAALSEIFRTLH